MLALGDAGREADGVLPLIWSMRRPASSLSANTVYDVNVHVGYQWAWLAAWVKKIHAIGFPASSHTWSQPFVFMRITAVFDCCWADATSSL